jgi:hypothetical protein
MVALWAELSVKSDILVVGQCEFVEAHRLAKSSDHLSTQENVTNSALNRLHRSDEVQACTRQLRLQHFGNFKIYTIDASKLKASLG